MSVRRWTGGELRREPWTNEWVIVAPARARRAREGAGACPFCPGPGEDAPPERWRVSTSDAPGWRVRAVANRYALSDHHEVVIESPHHDWDLTTATTAEVIDALTAWQVRLRALRTGAAEVVMFRNKGEAAGSSLAHPHSQVLGLPVLSGVTTRNVAVARDYHQRMGHRLVAPFLAWHLQVLPRLSTAAGLEVATGIPVLTTRPEECAARLRTALPVDATR
jgi:UDPglucose--hexose-1-phosphate uridylyltransferase